VEEERRQVLLILQQVEEQEDYRESPGAASGSYTATPLGACTRSQHYQFQFKVIQLQLEQEVLA
jgi:hypothetical protein